MKKYIYLLVFVSVLIQSCSDDHSNMERNIDDKEKSNSKKDILDNLLDKIDEGETDSLIFQQFYLKPNSIYNNAEILAMYKLDLKGLKWMLDNYSRNEIMIYYSDDMLSTSYELFHEKYSKDKYCDLCALVHPAGDSINRVLFCFKNNLVYSTYPVFDFEKFEAIWM